MRARRVASRTFVRTRAIITLALAALLANARAADKKSDPSDAFFRESAVRVLEIEVPASSLSALKEGQREYVRATVREGPETWRDVGVRIKGHASFQPFDRKPNLALKFNEFATSQEFHGLGKVVLNNCAQDPSYMREVLATQLFHDAGLPAARVTHARVQLNGRDVGFYTLVEGVNKAFLKHEFGPGSTGGHLYEGETRDIDQRLDQENGTDKSQQDLQALVAAAGQPAAVRMEKLRAVLDVDEFTSFVAMEVLLASIDGYTFRKNNYRVFHHPKTDRLMFLPHGLETTFGSSSFEPPHDSVLLRALWELPEFQKAYRARLGELGAKVWNVATLTNRVAALTTELTAAAPDRATALRIEEEARKLCYQIGQQQQLLARELKRMGK